MSHNHEEEIDYESLPAGSSMAINMFAGAMAGISEHAAIYPVDSIKTRMQILAPALSASTTGGAAAATTAPQQALSLAQHFRLVSSTEGIRSLWRGVASVIMGAGPAHACHFGTYEFVREMTGGAHEGVQGAAGTAVAGAAATIASDAFMNPFDVVKQRMQIRGSVHKSVLDCAKTLYRTEGFQAFYISYPTTLTMSIPLSAVQFSVYEAMKTFLNPTGEYSPSTHVMAGGVAGATAAAVTTPLDVAKTLLQTRGSSNDARIRNAQGMTEAIKIIWERDGLKGFRRGMSARVVTFAPSTAISWFSYEFFNVDLDTPFTESFLRDNDIIPGTHSSSA
ncbi:hypothetical protein QFC19_006687 [Naganishia cerealis]|uniref:Uncharacterized protein n=1 Tax=Naganishia cerealis TaxID=610337 RepID=A0ACC2VF86_9TREE|nr:hypothetical protein QFC19_006687 [Naganishia cerealis]